MNICYHKYLTTILLEKETAVNFASKIEHDDKVLSEVAETILSFATKHLQEQHEWHGCYTPTPEWKTLAVVYHTITGRDLVTDTGQELITEELPQLVLDALERVRASK